MWIFFAGALCAGIAVDNAQVDEWGWATMFAIIGVGLIVSGIAEWRQGR